MAKKKSNKKEIGAANTEKPIVTEKEKQLQSLQEFEIADGKSREDEIEKVKELEDLLGVKEMNPYKTLDRDIFSQNLASMSVADMTQLCSTVGINPPRFVGQMKKALMESFDMYGRKHNVNVQGQAKPIIDKSSPDYDSVVRLFKGE